MATVAAAEFNQRPSQVKGAAEGEPVVITRRPGIVRRGRTDPDQARILTRWFEQGVRTGFADRILPLDLAAARRVA